MEDNRSTRSFYVSNLTGHTIEIDNLHIDSDIYSIDTYNGSIILAGEGNYTLNNIQYSNIISLILNNQ